MQILEEYVFVKKWGIEGTAEGQIGNITISAREIAIDPEDNIYVADSKNHRIQKFDSNGNFIIQWDSERRGDGQFTNPDDVAIDSQGNVYVVGDDSKIQKFDSNGNFIIKWGSAGDGPGQFSLFDPYIAIDSSDNVYVTDSGNDRIQKFDSNGNFITQWGIRRQG